MDDAAAATIESPGGPGASRCPVDHTPPPDPPPTARCPVDHVAMAAEAERQATPRSSNARSSNDVRMRRLLRIEPDAPKVSLLDANSAFSRSVLVSAIRCLTTYVALPLLAPVIGLSGAAGPLLTIVLSVVSVTAIIISARRFFGSDHPWRWVHAALGAAIILLLAVSVVLDVLNLTNVI